MMSRTVTSEVARVEESRADRIIAGQLAEFGRALPVSLSPDKFARWCLTALRDSKLQEVLATDAGRLSVLEALMDCASLGLEPGREYHLVVFGGKYQDGTPKPKTVTGVTDYKGEIRLITNAQRCTVVAELVHAKDEFRHIGGNHKPVHEADWKSADRGPVSCGYAYVDFGDLVSQVVVMSEADFLKHREKSLSLSKAVWDEWPEATRVKTLVHQVRKFVSWSPEWRP